MGVLSLTPRKQHVAQKDRLVGPNGAWKFPPIFPSSALLQVPSGNPRCMHPVGLLSWVLLIVQSNCPSAQQLQVSSSASLAVCKPGLQPLAPHQRQLWSAYHPRRPHGLWALQIDPAISSFQSDCNVQPRLRTTSQPVHDYHGPALWGL